MHAGGDFITSATLQFVRELRINGQGTGHKDNINFTVTDGVVDQIRSKPCIHYACAADRHADSLFDFCGERNESADAFMGTVHQTGPVFAVIKLGTVTGGAVGLIYTVVGVGCPAVCFQPACSYTDLDKIRACGFQCLCQILRLFGDNKLVVCAEGFIIFFHGIDQHKNTKVVTDLGTHFLNDLLEEAYPVFLCLNTVFIFTFVIAACDKLVQTVIRGTLELNAVKPCLLQTQCAFTVAFYDVMQFFQCPCVRISGIHRVPDAYLCADIGTAFMDAVGNLFDFGDAFLIGGCFQLRELIDSESAGDTIFQNHQSGAAVCKAPVVVDGVLRHLHSVTRERVRAGSRLDDAVPKLHRANLNRRKQLSKICGCAFQVVSLRIKLSPGKYVCRGCWCGSGFGTGCGCNVFLCAENACGCKADSACGHSFNKIASRNINAHNCLLL